MLLIFALLPKVTSQAKPAIHHQKNVAAVVHRVAIRKKPATLASAVPAPKKVAAVAPAPYYPVGCQTYLPLVEQYPWPVSTAMAIMRAESTCNPNAISNAAINPDHIPDYGLFQLHGIDILNPAQNVAYAYYHKYLPAGGFTPWSTYNNGDYWQYL